MHPKLYKYLVDHATRGGQPVIDHIAGKVVGLDMVQPPQNKDARETLEGLLEDINRHEHSEGRSLLSALVIRKVNSLPSDEFFKLAAELGLYSGNPKDRAARRLFHTQELARVYEHWTGKKISQK